MIHVGKIVPMDVWIRSNGLFPAEHLCPYHVLSEFGKYFFQGRSRYNPELTVLPLWVKTDADQGCRQSVFHNHRNYYRTY